MIKHNIFKEASIEKRKLIFEEESLKQTTFLYFRLSSFL